MKKRGKTYLFGRFVSKKDIMKFLLNVKELDFLDIETFTNYDSNHN